MSIISDYWFSNGGGGPVPPDPGTRIGHSLRFRGDATLTRTPTTGGNRRIFTISFWTKFSPTNGFFVTAGSGGSNESFFSARHYGGGDGALAVGAWDGDSGRTAASFRDPSAWYHCCISVDTTQATANDRIRYFVNGARVDLGDLAHVDQNSDRGWNSAANHWIGSNQNVNSFLEGYLADFYNIDGQALEPTAFGRENNQGVWVPREIDFNGNWGANGCHLDFHDPDNLGEDASGNGNHWTPNNFNTAPVGIFSQYLISPGGFQPGRPATEAFTLTSPSGTFAMANKGSTLTWEPPGGIPYTNGYQVFANDADLWVNDVEKQRMNSADPIYFEAGSGTIQKLELRAQSIDFPQLSYILINGGAEQNPAPLPPNQNGIYLVDNTGVDFDSMEDSPTQNWATLNPLHDNDELTFSKANLDVNAVNTTHGSTAAATVPVSSGKWYAEVTRTGGSAVNAMIGISSADGFDANRQPNESNLGGVGTVYIQNGEAAQDGQSFNYGASYGNNEPIGILLDLDSTPRTVSFINQGVNQGALTIPDREYVIACGNGQGNANVTYAVNYGQRDFTHTPPADFEPFQTQNLPAATIPNGRDQFRALTGPGGGIGASGPNQLGGNWSPFVYSVPSQDPVPTTGFNKEFGSTNPASAFDGSDSTECVAAENAGSWVVFTPDEAITATSKVRVRTAGYGNIGINNISTGETVDDIFDIEVRWVDVSSHLTFPIDITSVATRGLQGQFNATFGGVEIDDKVLVDFSILALAQRTFSNGLWWIKDRVNDMDHELVDSVRGGNLTLVTPSNSPEVSYVAPAGSSVAWCWNAGGAAQANGNGTIPAQVAANTDAGFSIVTYQGNGSSGATIGHGLSREPEFIIFKNRDNGAPFWSVYHSGAFVSAADPKILYLNKPNQAAADTNVLGPAVFTSTTFSVGDYQGTNQSGLKHVAYCWHSVPGYSAFGSYRGNGDPDGPFIYTGSGFRPAFILLKNVTQDGTSWYLVDSTRNIYNPLIDNLPPNFAIGENQGNGELDFLSNGFKLRSNDPSMNSSDTFVYCCFAENPFGGSNVSPANAR